MPQDIFHISGKSTSPMLPGIIAVGDKEMYKRQRREGTDAHPKHFIAYFRDSI